MYANTRRAHLFIVQVIRAALQVPWHNLDPDIWAEVSTFAEDLYLELERDYREEAKKNDKS